MLKIAILGCQRSGTTLVSHIIGNHPDIKLFDHDVYFRNDLSEEDLIADVNNHNGISCVKAPQLVWHPHLFEDYKVIWVFRDPSEVVASMMDLKIAGKPWLWHYVRGPELPTIGNNDIEICANIWIAKNEQSMCLNHRSIYYSDICRDPRKYINRMCNHLGIEFDESMMLDNGSKHDISVGGFNPGLSIYENKREVSSSISDVVRPMTNDLLAMLLHDSNCMR